MAGFSDYLEDKVLDHVFGGVAYTAPTTHYVALYTVAPSNRWSLRKTNWSFYCFRYKSNNSNQLCCN
jgi:hypothetical protein